MEVDDVARVDVNERRRVQLQYLAPKRHRCWLRMYVWWLLADGYRPTAGRAVVAVDVCAGMCRKWQICAGNGQQSRVGRVSGRGERVMGMVTGGRVAFKKSNGKHGRDLAPASHPPTPLSMVKAARGLLRIWGAGGSGRNGIRKRSTGTWPLVPVSPARPPFVRGHVAFPAIIAPPTFAFASDAHILPSVVAAAFSGLLCLGHRTLSLFTTKSFPLAPMCV